jgi:polyvinyl alcohol dehydrogenase (cytochrome)
VASQEEALAASGQYPCCSFRGSFAALDAATAALLWKTFTAPDGFSGNAVWGSTPAIDPSRRSVYVATGNNYSVPQSVLDCVAAAGSDSAAAAACLPASNLVDSVVAMDVDTGAVRWVTRAIGFDAWKAGCIPFVSDGVNCPDPSGPGYDFGQGPGLFSVRDGSGESRALVGAGQKSGQYWTLDRDTGAVVWRTEAGPGGTAGGLQWGSAIDGSRVYTSNANSGNQPWELVRDGSPTGTVVNEGIFSAIDRATGKLLWQVAPPNGGSTSGPVTTANGVVYGCSLESSRGDMYAMDAATGEVLWTFASGGSCLSGAAISNGEVYWGSGYSNRGLGTPNNKLYAFGLPT